MKKQYLYPQNMRTEAKLWFWELKDIIISLPVIATLRVQHSITATSSTAEQPTAALRTRPSSGQNSRMNILIR